MGHTTTGELTPKPCPRCGGKPVMIVLGNRNQFKGVTCKSCGLDPYAAWTEDGAIMKWNSRPKRKPRAKKETKR